jgi:prepilin-type N-terminal cleavage/methylation domain-containing protein
MNAQDRIPNGEYQGNGKRVGGKKPSQGFTVLELMLAVAILAVISTLAYLSFSAVVSAWRRGVALSEDLHHGDFVMEQLVMALRSAYYPDTTDKGGMYGMVTEDRGSGETADDTICWVKLGGALVGKDSRLAGSPHRIKVSLEETPEGKKAVAVRAWRLHGQPDSFDPEEVEPVYLSTRVVGLNLRTAYRKIEDEIEWMDDWEETNRLPTVVEATLYLEPLSRGESPVELKRVFGVPVAPLCWR